MSSTGPGAEPNGTTTASNRLRAGLVLRLFVPFAAGYYLSYLFRTINAVAAPNLVADTGIGADALGFLTSMYLAAFAVLQLPLGMLLDRFGPRRVEAALLTIAAAGSIVFAFSDGLLGLSIGRALIGAGVSCCMMASFKAFAMWFAPHRLPSIYACLLAFGALGAISATVPVEWFLGLLGWRPLFIGLGLFALLVSLAVFTIVPDHHEPPGHTTFTDQLRGLRFVFRDRFFLAIAPLAAVSSGTSLAINGLWAGPWLRDVAGLARGAVATHLLIISASMGVGFLALGLLTERLNRLGLRPVTIAAGGMTAFMIMVAILAIGMTGPMLWVLLIGVGFLATSGSLSYSLVSRHFGRHLAGRANTAQNVLVFVAAFIIQWAIGGVLSGWEDPVTHQYDPAGYRVAFAGTVVVQAIALVWFLWQYAAHGQRDPGEPSMSVPPVTADEGGPEPTPADVPDPYR
ncbi:MAG: MFS transporter [Halofilum sp. (in: g-proteobacteria)]|nr:MFS transporter [Halofilum sp. (in: g-proteobacteria)]